DGEPFLCEAAQTLCHPSADDDGAERAARAHQREAEQQTVLEADPRARSFEPGVPVAELVDGVRAPAQAEADELRADDDEQRAADQRVDEEAAAEDRRV